MEKMVVCKVRMEFLSPNSRCSGIVFLALRASLNIRTLLRIAIGALLGTAAVTVVCWGALFVYGTYYLHGHGSLFDANPSAANAFFTVWFTLLAIGSIAGGYVASRK